MEAKLKEYRALRRRRELIESTKEKVDIAKQKISNFLVPDIFKNMNEEKKEDEVVLIPEQEEPDNEPLIDFSSEVSESDLTEDVQEESWRYCSIKWSLYTMIWLTLYLFFIKLQFGAVFFVISILIIICLNTRTRPKRQGEVSAYSVFNKNCKSINGTLKAEQFEREIRYGAGSVR